MKFFLDTADVDEIREWNATGLLDGVTTNPSLILKSGRDIKEVLSEICEMVAGDVSGEVAATDYDTMLREGRALAGIADNICIKLPITMDGV
ncbi:MAG: transaldolase family protein, partial [Pseudomonadota bacterium]